MSMLKIVLVGLAALVLAGLFALGGAFFIVDETQQVILTQFGRPVGEPITEAGLHIKLPFLQTAHYFDKRYMEWDGDPNQIPTEDKRFIWVDSYARWHITDPLLFFQRLRDEMGAQSRLDDILDGETRNTIAKHLLIEVVRSSNRPFDPGVSELPIEEVAIEIARGRSVLEREVFKNAAKRTSDLGIEILDFRFKRINYEQGVRKDVYARMVSERKRIAAQYRSEGGGEAARIQGDKERELRTIRSDAYRQSQEIKGRGDAEAADIYAEAYNKNPEFYAFMKSMDVLRNSLKTNTKLVLGTDGDLLRYLERVQ